MEEGEVRCGGRARRSEYWYFVLFTFLLGIAANIIDKILGWHEVYGHDLQSVTVDGFGLERAEQIDMLRRFAEAVVANFSKWLTIAQNPGAFTVTLPADIAPPTSYSRPREIAPSSIRATVCFAS